MAQHWLTKRFEAIKEAQDDAELRMKRYTLHREMRLRRAPIKRLSYYACTNPRWDCDGG